MNSQKRDNIDVAVESEKYGEIKKINLSSTLKNQIITSFINYRIKVDIIDSEPNVKKNQFVLLNKEKPDRLMVQSDRAFFFLILKAIQKYDLIYLD